MSTGKYLTESEFADEMQYIAEQFKEDSEAAHREADGLMCSVLKAMGFTKGIAIFEDMRKWYA